MSSPAPPPEIQRNKHSEPTCRRRLLLGVIVFLVGANVVLITGVIFMQEEIRKLKGAVEELNPLQGNIFKIAWGLRKTHQYRNDFAHGDSRVSVMTLYYLAYSDT